MKGNLAIKQMFIGILIFTLLDIFIYYSVSQNLFIVNLVFGIISFIITLIMFANNINKIRNIYQLKFTDYMTVYTFLIVSGIIGFIIIINSSIQNFMAGNPKTINSNINIDNIDLNNLNIEVDGNVINIKELIKKAGKINNVPGIILFKEYLTDLYKKVLIHEKVNKEHNND